MSRTVTALYDSPDEAKAAMQAVKAEAPITRVGAFDRSLESLEALEAFGLSHKELAACRLKLASGGYLLVAQIADGQDPQVVVDLLERFAESDESEPAAAPPQGSAADSAPPPQAAPEPAPSSAEAQPGADEEEVRIGTRQIVRGGATVTSRAEEPQRLGEVELIEEIVRVETRPASRLVSDEELEQAGLLRDRLIEIAQIREEPVIEKQAFVREEVVVTKTTERRTESILASPPRGQVRSNSPADRVTRELEDSHGRS
jgi:hypothetical protein